MVYGEEQFRDYAWGDDWDNVDEDMDQRCPECRSLNVRYFGVGVDKCDDCGAFLEAEDFDDDLEGTDRMGGQDYGEDWDW